MPMLGQQAGLELLDSICESGLPTLNEHSGPSEKHGTSECAAMVMGHNLYSSSLSFLFIA